MNCREAQNEIALLVGQDLEDRQRVRQVNLHLHDCPQCRAHQRQLKQALSAIERSEVAETYEVRNSLWPKVAARLDAPRVRVSPFKTWLPIASFMAACLMLAVVLRESPQHLHHGATNAVPRGTVFPSLSTLSQHAALDDHEVEKSGRDAKSKSHEGQRRDPH
jgi:hypothetical protein